jgi:hypothetical protein
MALDFQQVREQVRQLGENAPQREQHLKALRDLARDLLHQNAHELDRLREKVKRVVQQHDPSLRCALPTEEPLADHFPLPPLPPRATVLAADGSQIEPDRHAEMEYCLINVGAIQMLYGSPEPPIPKIYCRLFYDEQLYTPAGTITSATLALRRDLYERTILAELAAHATSPVLTFTDGLLEIWGSKDLFAGELSEFQKSLAEYLQVLSRMQELSVITAGYVDKPGSRLVVRLLEVAMTPEKGLAEIRNFHPLLGIYDTDLYNQHLGIGERSPVFAVESPSLKIYTGALALHFFYLNVGRTGHPHLARVEIPAWVAEDRAMLDSLHAVLVSQCRMMGSHPYPYLLHRAHETAVVTLQEKEQVTQMIALELRRRGVQVGDLSHKQANKQLAGRTRYKG